MSERGWNEVEAAQALLAAHRWDYNPPGKPCTECHCEDCLPNLKRPCCTLARLLLAAERIVARARRDGGREGA